MIMLRMTSKRVKEVVGGKDTPAWRSAQCPALAHLDLSDQQNFGSAGAERLAGVQGQCRELVHLNLGDNAIGTGGKRALKECWRSAQP